MAGWHRKRVVSRRVVSYRMVLCRFVSYSIELNRFLPKSIGLNGFLSKLRVQRIPYPISPPLTGIQQFEWVSIGRSGEFPSNCMKNLALPHPIPSVTGFDRTPPTTFRMGFTFHSIPLENLPPRLLHRRSFILWKCPIHDVRAGHIL